MPRRGRAIILENFSWTIGGLGYTKEKLPDVIGNPTTKCCIKRTPQIQHFFQFIFAEHASALRVQANASCILPVRKRVTLAGCDMPLPQRLRYISNPMAWSSSLQKEVFFRNCLNVLFYDLRCSQPSVLIFSKPTKLMSEIIRNDVERHPKHKQKTFRATCKPIRQDSISFVKIIVGGLRSRAQCPLWRQCYHTCVWGIIWTQFTVCRDSPCLPACWSMAHKPHRTHGTVGDIMRL